MVQKLTGPGYAAYEKLSPDFRRIIDGKQAVYRSAHPYLDRDDPTAGPKYIERVHPLVRVHLLQERMDLEHELQHIEDAVDLRKLEDDFVRAAKTYAQRKHISYAAWREAGVDAAVLKRAGISRAS